MGEMVVPSGVGGWYAGERQELFHIGMGTGTGGNGFKLHQGKFMLDRRGNFFPRSFQPWHRLPRKSWSHPWKCAKSMWLWHLRTLFSGAHKGAELMVGPDNLKSIFQPYNSTIL